MKQLIYLSAFTCLLRISHLSAQAPEIEWDNTIGGNDYDVLVSLQPTTDGGYILGGVSSSGISEDKSESSTWTDYWVVKLNADGTIEWDNTLAGTQEDFLSSIIQTSDNGYLAAGYSESNASADKIENSKGSDDYWIIKLDSSGETEWDNTIGAKNFIAYGDEHLGDDRLTSVEQTSDGGYILGGYSYSNASVDKSENIIGFDEGYINSDYWIVKLNADGQVEWDKTIGGWGDDYLKVIHQTSDNGYILGGHSQSDSSGDKSENNFDPIVNIEFQSSDYWIVKLNSVGEVEWDNTIGSTSREDITDLAITADGGYILCGESYSNISSDKSENSIGNNDYWIVKLNSLGEVEWENTIGGSSYDIATSIKQTSGGGYIVGGYSGSSISGDKSENSLGGVFDYWIVKLHIDGEIEWDNTLGGTGDDYLWDLDQNAAGEYILGGSSNSNMSADKTENNLDGVSWLSDYWVVKLESEDVCAIPTPIGAFSITSTSAKLKWDAIDAATGYQIYYRPVGTSTWQKKNSASNQKTITGLLCNTNYQWKIRLRCGTDFTSFSSLQTFTTGACRLGEINVANDNELNIYPNPNTGQFTIDFSEINSDKITSIHVKNMLGEDVYSAQLNSPQQTINLSNSVADGVYIVEVHTSKTSITKQVIIQK